MRSTYYPFRPNLQGPFLERFLSKAAELCNSEDPRALVDSITINEYRWATETVRVNPCQRRIYRAVWLFLRDLLRAGWTCRWYDSNLELAPPALVNQVQDDAEKNAVKASVRGAMADARRHLILKAREFIERMENPSPNSRARVPITALIADGEALAADLSLIAQLPGRHAQLSALRQTVRPYLQLVRENEICPETGLRLGDIWRYFRLTWATPAENTPGRTLLYLIRDAGRPYHPVMGIASLENAPIRITSRDDHLGWSLKAFRQQLESSDDVRKHFERLLNYIRAAIDDISLHGLCTPEECEQPSDQLLQRLAAIAERATKDREEALRLWSLGSENRDEDIFQEKSELGNIPKAAEEALYRRKRADQLGRLLVARRVIQELVARTDLESIWYTLVDREHVQTAIRTALQAQKSRHIGTSILELNVCGAIPPYNEILGGKLVALVMLSPQVVSDYRHRYGDRPSDIASRLKGEHVVRPAELVYVGTTSLYRVGSSQYNRLKLPAGILRDQAPEVRWELVGETTGYGTLHISRLTLQCLEEVAYDGGVTHVNHVFGEGPSPKLRIIRQALDTMFEPGQREVTYEFQKHAMVRLVYGCFLTTNARAYLLGEADNPEYYFEPSIDPLEGTERIVDYWRERWLLSRIQYGPALDRIKNFDPKTLLLSNELSSKDEPTYQPILVGGEEIPGVMDKGKELRDFVRNLYRGSSAYADRIDLALLNAIHVPTDLDVEIVKAVEAGKSVILTGNPGDGKSHLLRVLSPELQRLATNPVIVLDASSVLDDELVCMWADAQKQGRPFCVAINEAVLFNLANNYPNFHPLQEARMQVEQAILYGDEADQEFSVVVFDLSRRNVLSSRMVLAVLDKLTDSSFIPQCANCPAEGCDFVRNREILKNPLVRDRLQDLLNRVSRRGYHATLREVLALASYLLFADRDCLQMLQTSGEQKFALPELPFSGTGNIFEAIRETFDPGRVTHPVWDEILILGETEPDHWVPEWRTEVGSIDPVNNDRVAARKRAFYFFHQQGDALLSMAGKDELDFAEFLKMEQRDALRLLFRRINRFFGSDCGNEELRVWQSHRYNQSPRRILYSFITRHRKEFEIVHPKLRTSMARAFDLAEDHVLLRLKKRQSAKLRVDFSLFQLLAQVERGVPVMFMETDATRRLWSFLEALSEPIDYEEDVTIIVFDPISGEQLTVIVDLEKKRYLSVDTKQS